MPFPLNISAPYEPVKFFPNWFILLDIQQCFVTWQSLSLLERLMLTQLTRRAQELALKLDSGAQF